MLAPTLVAAAIALAGAVLPTAARAEESGEPAPAERGAATTRRYVIEAIRFVGIEHTRPEEVRRHLDVAEGQLLDDQAVLLSRLRLLQLGWFSSVETRVERGSRRGRVVLVFTFTERNTLLVSDLVLGSTGPQPLYGGFGLSQANFLGYGLGLSGAFVYGGDRFAVRGALLVPDLAVGDLRLVGGLSLLLLRGEEFACSTTDCAAYGGSYAAAPRLRYRRVGGEAHVGLRPGAFERLTLGWRLEHVSADAVAGDARDPGVLGPNLRLGGSTLSALTASYERDTRNDPFLPTEGTRLLVSITFGSEKLGGDYEYGRYLLQLESDHALPNGHALKLLGAAGAVQGDAPFFERFYAADWSYFTLGPALGRALELNFSTDSRYDAYLAMLGAEYAIPLWSSRSSFFHRGYVALGARWVYTAATGRAGRTPLSTTPFSGEVALRLDTPVGSFNLSLGYALDNFL